MGLAIDTSTPAVATANTVTTLTSNSFSPPGGSLLVVVAGSGFAGGTVSSMTDSLASHLTYTKLVQRNHNTNCDAEIWVADVPGTAPGAMTITTTVSASGDPELGVIVFTGAQNAAAQVANANTAAADGVAPSTGVTTPNPVAAGSQVIMVVGDWSNGDVPTPASGQTITFNGNSYHVTDGAGDGWWAQCLSSPAAGGSTVTMSDSFPTGTITAMVCAEILAAGGGSVAAPATFSVSDPTLSRIPGIH